MRDKLASDSLDMLIQWLKDGGNVGILGTTPGDPSCYCAHVFLDATNSTLNRRQVSDALSMPTLMGNPMSRASVEARVDSRAGNWWRCSSNLCATTQLSSPRTLRSRLVLGTRTMRHTSPEEAKLDFLRRIKQYEAVYQTISESHLSYLKIINVGSQVILNRINGYLQSRIAFYLMNLHLKPRSIFFSRHGESQFNVEGKIGGDSALSSRGMRYARALPDLITDNIGNAPLTVSVPTAVHPFYSVLTKFSQKVWTSTLHRTIQTGQFLPYNKLTWKSLDELDAGVCDGMTYEEIEVSV
jgi:6-phosphofructo-2-kinase/fructose-2,6-biphosphatase 2